MSRDIALVTGGTGGIGSAICRRLVDDGFSVVAGYHNTAKAGMHGFTKALAQEVASKGITVNTISPGYIATAMIMKVADEIREQIRQQIPVKRFGQPEEIARAVSFLVARDAGYITGADLSINGGQYMH